jgi:heme a synthase
MTVNRSSISPYSFAVATSICTILLLMFGALVTSNDAAESVPDWPLAYGKLIPPMIGGIRFEYAHRVMAAVVSLLTLILASWLAIGQSRRLARRMGWTALGLVIAQAVLGGIRVLAGHPALFATAHAVLAQIFFILIVGLSLYLSPWWQRASQQHKDSSSVCSLAIWTTFAILAQLILGAAFRHGAFGIMPHLFGAVIVTLMVTWTGHTIRKRFPGIRALRRGVTLLQGALGIQILLGGAAWWTVIAAADAVQPTVIYVALTVAHVLGGALTLAASVLLTLACFRRLRSPVNDLSDLTALIGAGQHSSLRSPQRAGI